MVKKEKAALKAAFSRFSAFCQSFFQCLGKLVGTRCVFESAGVAFKTGDKLGCCHAFSQKCNRFEIAVASAGEGYVAYDSVVDLKINL